MDKTAAYYLTYLYRSFLAYTTKKLKTLGLNYGQLPFILYIGKCPRCTQAELKNGLDVDWGHCQRSVDKLVMAGFAEKTQQDGERVRLSLTPKGEQAFLLSHQVFDAWDREHLQALTPDEREQLLALLGKLTGDGKRI